MKHLVLATLLTALLAGCADTPTQQASIEDRSVATDAAKPDAIRADAARTDAARADAVRTDAMVRTDIDQKAMDAKAADVQAGAAAATRADGKAAGKVETKGVAAPVTEVKALAGASSAADAGGMAGAAAAEAGAGGQAGQPALDAKSPMGALAERRILFDYDSAAIRDEYRALLEANAQYLKQRNLAKAILQGHADERGSREYNLALGQRRAESVYKAMNLLGVAERQIEAVSLGEEKPIAEGHDEDAWRQNRRVEIIYQGE